MKAKLGPWNNGFLAHLRRGAWYSTGRATLTLVGLVACRLALAQTNTAGAEPASAETTPAPLQPGAVIPLIQFQDVPLTTAIENLARQANINYILDPKVGYGQPDEKGVVKVQPNISIRWENLTAEQALTALLNNYSLQMVEDPKTKIARVTVKDPAAPEPLVTKIIQLKFASPSNILASVQSVLTDKRSKVVADVRTSQLVVSATEKEMEAADKLIASLDTQTKQVLIEAKILETTLSPKTDKGIDWSGTLANQHVSFGNNQRILPVQDSVNPINPIGDIPKLLANTGGGFSPATAFLNADGVSAVISFLNISGDTRVVSEPRMVTLDNQKASIDVGLMFPIVNTSAGTANTAGGSSISYSNLTVNLDVTPRIAANNFVELKVLQNVLRLGPNVPSTVGGVANSVASFFSRRLDTSVLIPSGNTLVMGGLIQDQTGTANTKVPILGDIPGLGLLFRKDHKELNRQNLTIFITPTIVEDTDYQPAHTDYLKTTGKQDVKEDWSAWDSGKPRDWSKPAHRDSTK
jgi:type IV pilus assembly protein PilQ